MDQYPFQQISEMVTLKEFSSDLKHAHSCKSSNTTEEMGENEIQPNETK